MDLNSLESPAVLTIDTPITWYSQLAHLKCECRLRIYRMTVEKSVVIVSELDYNPGRSITDEALTLIHLLGDEFELNPTKTMWIEHYPVGYLKDEETYEQVLLWQGYTYSKRISKQKLEALLGVKL